MSEPMNQSKTKTDQVHEAEGRCAPASCSHPYKREVGITAEQMGSIVVDWCPDCGALKRTMVNWKYTDYPWEPPRCANTKGQP